MNSNNVAIAPVPVAASNPSTLVHEIRATLAAASDYMKVQNTAVTTARKCVVAQSIFAPHTAPCDTYSLSLGPISVDARPTAMPLGRKIVEQVILSQISSGAPVLMAPSDKSSRGLLSPIPSMTSRITSVQDVSHRQVDDTRRAAATQCRNFPLWYSNSSSEPL